MTDERAKLIVSDQYPKHIGETTFACRR